MQHISRSTGKSSAAAIAGLASIAALGVGVAAAQADAHGTAAPSTSHSLTFSTHQIRDQMVHGVDLAVDKIVQHGAVTGFDTTSCRMDPTTRVALCDVAMSRSTGLLYAHIRFDANSQRVTGRVTGGTRHFRGASGTVSGTGSQITLRYTN